MPEFDVARQRNDIILKRIASANMPNMLDSMIDDAIVRGLRQGLEQGRVEGKRDDVRVIVRARFGAIPVALEQRIAADVAALDDLLPRAATAERIEDLG